MQYLKTKLINYLTDNLLMALTRKDVISIVERLKAKMDTDELAELKQQAKEFRTSLLWERLRYEIEVEAVLKDRKATSFEGRLFERAMLHNLDIIEKFLNYLKSL